METIRSFIAFDIDDQQVLRSLSQAQKALLGTGADLKIVEPENIHVTLKFLGNIPANMVDDVHEEMRKIDFAPFDIRIEGLGVFPNPRNIRVVWTAIKDGADELRNIHKQLESNLRNLGFSSDPKGFSPHLTIARVRTGRNKNELTRIIEQMSKHEIGVIKARCLRLKKSVLTPKGPIYSVLKEVCR